MFANLFAYIAAVLGGHHVTTYDLVMIVSVNTEHNMYVIDHGLTTSDCYNAALDAHSYSSTVNGVRIIMTYSCNAH
jgi:metal-sulfur cluster biosynthetic enzyme